MALHTPAISSFAASASWRTSPPQRRKLEDMTLDEMEEYYQLARRRLEDKDPPKGFEFKSVILSEER
jgi:hypothetical protein